MHELACQGEACSLEYGFERICIRMVLCGILDIDFSEQGTKASWNGLGLILSHGVMELDMHACVQAIEL